MPLLPDEIYLPPAYQPINPEDEDDVVPDQHAAFGINRAIKGGRRPEEPIWRDLGLDTLLRSAGGAEGGESRETEAGNGTRKLDRLLARPIGATGRSGNLLRARRAVRSSVGSGLRS